MQVSEVLTFAEYFRDPRFEAKKPVWEHGVPLVRRCGDNCYEPLALGGLQQLPSRHYDHKGSREQDGHKRKGLRGRHVLVSQRFAYFGSEPKKIPAAFSPLMPARFNRRVESGAPEFRQLLAFLKRLPTGVHAPPRTWGSDESWQAHRCG